MPPTLTKILIDGQPYEAPLGGSLIEFLFSLGKDVPHFCYHPALPVVASCRQCQVENKGKGSKPGLVVACREKIVEGMEVLTESPPVVAARAAVMEFLLINHPLDCPICDKAGECRLQDTAYQTGQAASRFLEPKRNLRKRVDLGDVILLDEERCILCTRCVRFFETVEGKAQITVVDRGDRSIVGTFRDRPLTGNYQGNLADICPVGALTLKSFRFDTRVWDLQKTETVCGLCSRGCNTIVETKRNQVHRIRPRPNPAVNGYWMCDQGRLEFEDLNWTRNDGRVFEAYVAGPEGVLVPAPMEAAIEEAARLLAEAGPDVVAICSPFATCEEGEQFQRTFAGAKTLGFFDPGHTAKDDGILHTDDPCPNRRGLTEVAGLRPLTAELIAAALPDASAVFIGGERSTQLLPDSLKVALKTVPAVILHTRRLENLTYAKVAIPCLSSVEKWGTWVNVDGIRQQVAAALPAPPRVRPDAAVLALIAATARPVAKRSS